MTRRLRSIDELDARELRARYGIARSYVSELLNRHKRPSLELAVRIEIDFGVPPRAWVPDAKPTPPPAKAQETGA